MSNRNKNQSKNGIDTYQKICDYCIKKIISTKTHLLKHITLEQVIFRTEKAIKGIHLSKSRCLVQHTQNKCSLKKKAATTPPYV